MGRFGYSLDVGEELDKEEREEKAEKGDFSVKEVAPEEIVPIERSPPPKESFILTKDDLKKKGELKEEKKEEKKEERKEEKKEHKKLSQKRGEKDKQQAVRYFRSAKAKPAKADAKPAKKEKEEKEEQFDNKKDIPGRESEKTDKEDVKSEKPQKPQPKLKLEKYDDTLFVKLRKYETPLLLLLLLIIGFIVLSQPAKLGYIEDQAAAFYTEKETASVVNSVILEFPMMDVMQKDKIAAERVQARLADPEFKQRLNEFVEKKKNEYRTPAGEVYLLVTDSYYYFRQANNLFEYGSIGDTVDEKGKPFNSYRNAPDGARIKPTLSPYAIYYFSSILSIFGGVSLLSAAFYLPVVAGLLSIVLIFFIGKKIGSSLAGFLTALCLAIHPWFFINTAAGMADTGFLNVFFSLSIVLLFIHLMDFKNNSRMKNAAYLVLFALALYLFRFTWTGYYYLIVILALFLIVYGAYHLIRRNKGVAGIGIGAAALVIVIILAYSLRNSKYAEHILSRLNLLQEVSAYPTAIHTVSELQRSSFAHMINSLGGPAICLFALAGAVCIIYRVYTAYKKDEDAKYHLFLLVWLVPLLIATCLANKFIVYLVPPFCVFVGIFLCYAYPHIIKFFKSINLAIDPKYLKPAIAVILAFAVIFCLSDDVAKSNDIFPFMNDGISFTSVYLRDSTPADSVINLWWDNGYTFEHYTERAAIMDNGNFNGVRLYLFSRAMMATDEYLAKDLLKIIDCGLDDEVFSEQELRSLDNKQLDLVARKRANCTAPPAYLVVTFEDIRKINVINSFADWDFRRNFMMQDTAGLPDDEAVSVLAERYNLSEDDARDAYLGLELEKEARDVKFSEISECGEIQGVIVCDNGFVINGTDARSKAGGKHPDKLYRYEGGNRTVTDYTDTRSDLSLVLFATKKGWRSMIADSETAESVIIRAFAGEKFDGMSIVYQVTSPYQINTYKIEW
jgi:hypothetical protein